MAGSSRETPIPAGVTLLDMPFSALYVENVLAISSAAARELIDSWQARGFVVAASGDRLLVEPAVAESKRKAMTPAQRRAVHLATAERLVASPDAAMFQLEIARHLRAAGLLREALEYYVRFAEDRTVRNRHAEAREVLREALAASGSGGPEIRVLLELAAHNAELLGEHDRAMRLLEQARRHASAAGDASMVARTLIRQAILEIDWDRYREASAYAARALRVDIFSDLEAQRDRSRAQLLLGECALGLGAPDDARAHVLRARAASDAFDVPDIEPHGAYLEARLLMREDPERAAEHLRSAALRMLANGDPLHAIRVYESASTAAFAAADLSVASAMLGEAELIAQRHGIAIAEHRIRLAQIRLLCERGSRDEALRRARLCAQRREMTPTDGEAIALALAVDERDGDLIDAFENTAVLDAVLASGSARRATLVVPAYAAAERYRGRAKRSEALLRQLTDLMWERATCEAVDPTFLIDLAQYARLDDLDRTSAIIARFAAGAGRLASLVSVIATNLVARRRTGSASLAPLTDVGQQLADRGFVDISRYCFEADAGPRIGARNARVLWLIQQGLTNDQVGKALQLGKRTVENSVGELLRSYDVRSRWQLMGLDPAGEHRRAQPDQP